MLKDDVRYCRRRAEVETELVAKAECPEAVAAHFQLATLYFEYAEKGEKPKALCRD